MSPEYPYSNVDDQEKENKAAKEEVDIETFFCKLIETFEENSSLLKNGDVFGTEYLVKKRFSKWIFSKLPDKLAKKLGGSVKPKPELHNYMPEPLDKYHCGRRQVVDYAFQKYKKNILFLELETLDRAQLYLFHNINKDDDSASTKHFKLKYYYGTIVNHVDFDEKVPKYFVWLLILPDKKVDSYQVWDSGEWDDDGNYIFHPTLKKLVFQNPFQFYDHLIKKCARLYLQEDRYFEKTGKAVYKKLKDYQDVCELVFITCTGREFIMSRGSNLFEKDIRQKIKWRS